MNKLLLLLLVSLLGACAASERGRLPSPPGPPGHQDLADTRCMHRDRYMAVQRRAFFPFGVAQKVLLVGFHGRQDTMRHLAAALPRKNASIDFAAVEDSVLLTADQIDQLTDLLYNVGYRRDGSRAEADIGCYNPRNAILFLDAQDSTVAFVEICFSCFRSMTSDERISLGEVCSEKYKLLLAFFRKAGIRYGVDRFDQNDAEPALLPEQY
jgi:hypothetical protein